MKYWLYRQGNNPQRSVRVFFCGLLSFCSGLGLLSYHQQGTSWQGYLAVIIITLSLITCAYGYLGIVANRLSHLIDRAEQARRNNPHD
ncbi:hypothetical protein [Psychrobium sp. 1_MG-2023]|uniref:hypothetical protein n=1 Tax=Psychrobium sp. 1_MG-2023 TaxID=3062624 RepID=UPI0012920841|nr:hypothetical protein [Psychrobium sp. 1_MG-2023]MDP2561953.1 hypothetical protein [Psychrobium sp. 1_MG-2023]